MADTPAAPAPAPEPTDVNSESEFTELGSLVEESTTTAAPSTEESKAPAEEAEGAETPEAQPTETETPKDEPDEAKPEEPTETEQPPKKDAEARKAQLQQEIRQLVAERNKRRDEVKQLVETQYRTETVEELEEQGYSPREAEIEAQRQQLELAQYQGQLANMQETINIEIAQVLTDFPVFDRESPQYDKALAERAWSVYQNVAKPDIDERTGMTRQVNVLPYEIYKAFAETHTSGATRGEAQAQKAAERMMASAEPRASATPPTSTEDSDPFLSGFERVT